MEDQYLIAGLGNPGRRYQETRHNAGFMVVERLAERWQATWTDQARFQTRLARADREGSRFLLSQPQTFMNSSGEAVAALSKFYRLNLEKLLVIVDDADLKLGSIRLRAEGSSGGHHGLESVEQHLGTRDFARLRIGIGRADPASREIAGYVLSTFEVNEFELREKVLARACDQVECWAREGIASAMNRFNGAVKL